MSTKTEQKVTNAIAAIEHLDGLNIELCGTWVWVSGETKKHKEELYNAGYRWSGKKVMWYFPGSHSRGRGRYSIDDIREMHGSEKVKGATA